jgi:hypothetical protein
MLRHICKLAFCLILFAPAVLADPIEVSGGPITVINGPSTLNRVVTEPFVLTGTNFTANINSVVAGFGLADCAFRPIGGVPPCSTANLGFSATGTDVQGSFTLNGQTAPISVVNSLGLFVTAPTFVIPLELIDAAAVEVIAPFSLSGTAALINGPQASITAAGTVRLLLTRQTHGNFTGLYLSNAVYTFGAVAEGVTIQEVPEPITLLLFGTGLGVMGLLKKRGLVSRNQC